jgi:hypothetical protein
VRRLLLLAVLFQARPVQEEELHRLKEQLGTEDAAVRQRAERRLLEIGEPARPILEDLVRNGDVEVSERARQILAGLDREASRGQFLGRPWTVTLEDREVALGDLPSLLKDQIPAPLKIPETVAASRIRIGARSMEAWRFLDQVCGLQGNLTIPLAQPPDALVLKEGSPAGSPVSYSGQYRFSIDRITLESRHPYDTPRTSASMLLGVLWQPNVHPLNNFWMGRHFGFTVSELEGDDGVSLLNPEKEERDAMMLEVSRACGRRGRVVFRCPAPQVRKLQLVRGRLRLVLPAKKEMIEFKGPSLVEGRKAQAGPYTIELRTWKPGPKGVQATLGFWISPRDSENAVRQSRVELGARFQNETIIATARSGKQSSFSVYSSSHRSAGGDLETEEDTGTFDVEGEVESLRIPFVSDVFDVDVPFEFRDVELP